MNLRYRLEAALVKFLFTGFRLLPLDVASFIGSFMASAIGPFMPAHQYAKENLKKAFPEKSQAEINKIVSSMWKNLGRTAAEFPNLPGSKLTRRMQRFGKENLPAPGKSVIFFGGHMANWELLYCQAFDEGVPISLIYRHINNPYIDKMVQELRGSHSTSQFPKGPKGAIPMLRAIKNGESIAMLIDQKMNSGVPIPFFGRDAMTAPAIAELSLKLHLPIIPARVIRKKGAHFEGYLYPALQYEKTGDKEKDVRAILVAINNLMESWIREYPDQWFWVHRRWPKEPRA